MITPLGEAATQLGSRTPPTGPAVSVDAWDSKQRVRVWLTADEADSFADMLHELAARAREASPADTEVTA